MKGGPLGEAAHKGFGTLRRGRCGRRFPRDFELFVERVEYDGAKGKVSITFHSAGIKTLSAEMVTEQKGESA